MTWSLTVNGPRLCEIPKKVTFWQVTYPQFAIWERQKLEGNSFCRLRRIVFNKGCKDLTETTAEGYTKLMVTEISEELIDSRNNDGSHETDDPSTESRGEHRGIVGVGHRRQDFGIWRFSFEFDGRGV
jgi:hypothetical protein